MTAKEQEMLRKLRETSDDVPKGNGHVAGEPWCTCNRFYDMSPCLPDCDLAVYRRKVANIRTVS